MRFQALVITALPKPIVDSEAVEVTIEIERGAQPRVAHQRIIHPDDFLSVFDIVWKDIGQAFKVQLARQYHQPGLDPETGERIPDLSLDVFMVGHGIQVDVGSPDLAEKRSICRDFGDSYEDVGALTNELYQRLIEETQRFIKEK